MLAKLSSGRAPAPLPWPARALNATGGLLKGLGLELLELDPMRIRLMAQEAAGGDDFGGSEFEEGLAVALESAERDARLSLLGRVGIRDMLVNALTQRLLRVRLRRERPELFETPLTPPLIVIGLPRSGTTLLHRLLALGSDARSLRYWELRRPLAEPSGGDRLAWARGQQRSFQWLARGIDVKHVSGPDEPEECLFLFDSTFVSSTFWIAAPLYGYLRWYLAQDQSAPYRAYRDYLALFQAETPDRRLTLKAPIHTAHLPALLAAVPEARLVQLHRDPRPALASANSLFATLHRVVTDDLDVRRLGRANFELFATGTDRLLDARATLPERMIHDVYYDDLVRDPIATVRKVHRHFELPFDTEYEARLRAFVQENPQHKHGTHRYAARDFGLTDEAVAARFSRYLETFPRARRAQNG